MAIEKSVEPVDSPTKIKFSLSGTALPNRIVVAPGMPKKFSIAPLPLPVDTNNDVTTAEPAASRTNSETGDELLPLRSEVPLPNRIVVAKGMPAKFNMALPPLDGAVDGLHAANNGATIELESAESQKIEVPRLNLKMDIGSSLDAVSAPTSMQPLQPADSPVRNVNPTSIGVTNSHVASLFDKGAVCARWQEAYMRKFGSSADYGASSDTDDELLLQCDIVSVMRSLLLGVTSLKHMHPAAGTVITPIAEAGSDDSYSSPDSTASSVIHPAVYKALQTFEPKAARVSTLAQQLYLPVTVIVSKIAAVCDCIVQNGVIVTAATVGETEETVDAITDDVLPVSSFVHSTPKAYHSSTRSV